MANSWLIALLSPFLTEFAPQIWNFQKILVFLQRQKCWSKTFYGIYK